ncbi:hypothetical protein [Bradyrhizobium niftali]|jgi:hypothetical protein|uniref:Adenylate cyclase n=1 Tax=Bradyrhizobium niftali TaxID=2560055 RepID=A0A4Y9LPT7_9BRAD|nr:hypothetical protein [Bradyrhizobium niftali]TFV45351.1 hypothetical protein E4K65_25180 [Bradyrhizobium niftali]
MMKTVVVVGALLLATSAFAQTDKKELPGASQYAPGQQMQEPNAKSTAPGASEYAPGHQKNTTAGPGHSESAPGQQTTTGSSSKPDTSSTKK